jgi:hypothetical protein
MIVDEKFMQIVKRQLYGRMYEAYRAAFYGEHGIDPIWTYTIDNVLEAATNLGFVAKAMQYEIIDEIIEEYGSPIGVLQEDIALIADYFPMPEKGEEDEES